MTSFKLTSSIFLLLCACFVGTSLSAQPSRKLSAYKLETFSEKDLLEWENSGKGQMAANHGQLVLSEIEKSAGYMIISPDSYGESVVMAFDVMTLNPATVLVVEMCASNKGDGQIELPEGYNGNVKYLFDNMEMYMFAFHNAAHNKPGPFVRKFPKPGAEPLAAANKNALTTGVFHHVEVGKESGNLWLKVDGKKVVRTEDNNYLKNGKLIFRIRGTAHELASCILKNMKIYSK